MKINVLVLGIVFIAIGLIMWIVGGYQYDISYRNYLTGGFIDILGGNYPQDYKASMAFWSMFSAVGFLLFIFGIPITIGGAIIGEKKDIIFQKSTRYIPEKQQSYSPSEPIQQPPRKEFFCSNCGTKLDGSPTFCFNCGFKLR